jgi:hypothetical protein
LAAVDHLRQQASENGAIRGLRYRYGATGGIAFANGSYRFVEPTLRVPAARDFVA